jgi:hypothetical protein
MRSPLRLMSSVLAAAMCAVVDMDERATEATIQNLGLTRGPRLTPDDIDRVIVKTEYHVFAPTTTVCCITLINGYTVIGESACVSPVNFDEGIGREIAYKKARDKIWALEGYLLAQYLKAGRRSDDTPYDPQN